MGPCSNTLRGVSRAPQAQEPLGCVCCLQEGLGWDWAAGHYMEVTTSCTTLAPCPCQSVGDQLSQELKRVKNELERVKGELGMWSWLFWGLQDTRNPDDTPCTCTWSPAPAAPWGWGWLLVCG